MTFGKEPPVVDGPYERERTRTYERNVRAGQVRYWQNSEDRSSVIEGRWAGCSWARSVAGHLNDTLISDPDAWQSAAATPTRRRAVRAVRCNAMRPAPSRCRRGSLAPPNPSATPTATRPKRPFAPRRQKMSIFLHGKRLITPLVHMSKPDIAPVLLPAADMRNRQTLHERSQVPIVFWPQKEMPMVGHQAICTYSHRCRLQRVLQNPPERPVVSRLFKQLHARHTTIQNMKHHPARGYSCSTRHSRKPPQTAHLVNAGPVPLGPIDLGRIPGSSLAESTAGRSLRQALRIFSRPTSTSRVALRVSTTSRAYWTIVA